MKTHRLLVSNFALWLVLAPAVLRAADVRLFAAASLSDALAEIVKTYEPASGDKVVLNLAASSLLARQIQEGAPADLFFSADEAKMNDLARAGRIVADTRRTLLGNTLVVVAAADSTLLLNTPADLARADVGRLALAEPQTVPAGIYAREYLQRADIWVKVIDKVVPTENVRACLAAVESGNVEAGIVYKTDALISRRVKIAFEIPDLDGPKISYPLAVVTDAPEAAAAHRLAAHLASPEAIAVFVKFGFLDASR